MEIENGLWRHSKSGKKYMVIANAYDSETMKCVVVYQAQYDSSELGPNPVFVRPIDMWDQLVDIEGVMIPRFVKI